MNHIKTSYNQVKHFVVSDSENKIIAVIKVNPSQYITTNFLQAISEEEDCDTAELLNSFEMNEVTIYIARVKIIFENLGFEDIKYYHLTPGAIY